MIKLLKSFINIYYKIIFICQSFFFNIDYSNVKVSGVVFFKGRGKISIGKKTILSSGRLSNPLGGETRLSIIVSKNASLTIGDHCGISNAVIFCTHSITIENNVLIGNGSKIYDNDFHPLNPLDRIQNKKPLAKPIRIKKNAFIGAHCILLKGVTIGENAVVGAGSVITKDIPDNEIWAGNPARFIRKIYE